MPNIGVLNSFSNGTVVNADPHNANWTDVKSAFNTSAVLTDVARTISVTHTWSAVQNFVGGITGPMNADNLTSGTVPAARMAGAYSGITGVGTLLSLAVSGAVTGGTYNGQTISATASFTGSVAVATTLVVSGQTIAHNATADPWFSTINAVQVRNGAVFSFGNSSTYLDNNSYIAVTTGTDTYRTTGAVARLRLVDDQLIFYNAPSGTAGTAATLTNRFSIGATGAVTLSSTLVTVGASEFRGVITAGTTGSNVLGQIRVGGHALYYGTIGLNAGTSGAIEYNTIGAGAGAVAHDFKTDGTTRVSITGTGAVTLSSTLAVPRGGVTTPSIFFTGDTDTGLFSDAANDVRLVTGGGAAGDNQIILHGTDGIYLRSGGGNRLHVSTAGSTTITNNAVSGSSLLVQNTGASANATIQQTYAAGAAFAGFFLVCSITSGDKLRIAADGNVTNTNNSYGAISDRKLKQDITPAASQWEDVKALGALVKKFRLKDDKKRRLQIGWVAQEVEKVSPGLVYSTDDFKMVRGVRKKLGTKTLGIHYSVAHMKAFKALGEALERIEKLEAQLPLKTTQGGIEKCRPGRRETM